MKKIQQKNRNQSRTDNHFPHHKMKIKAIQNVNSIGLKDMQTFSKKQNDESLTNKLKRKFFNT